MPRPQAFGAVTVKGHIDRVEVVAAGQVVACHGRCYGRDQQILDPLHYLAVLPRRPAALDHAPVLRNWHLPEALGRLRQALERRHGPRAGSRQYIRVLQLLPEHPLERVRQAVESCLLGEQVSAEAIRAQAEHLAARVRQPQGGADDAVTSLCQYQVPRPDLGQFDRLLREGDSEDV